MQEHEYKARDKTVKKMSREGLTEQNLHSKAIRKISRRNNQTEDGTDAAELEREDDYGQPIKRQHDFTDVAAGKESIESGEAPEDMGELPEEMPGSISEHSARMDGIRGHPSGRSVYTEAAVDVGHNRKKKLVQAYARKEKNRQAAAESRSAGEKEENSRFQKAGKASEQTAEDYREEIKGKTKREQLHKEQRKQTSRLSFGDEDDGMVHGAGMGITKKAASALTDSAAVYLHGKGHEAEQDNGALEGSHRAELMAENALRYAMHKTNRGLQGRNYRLQSADPLVKGGLQFGAAQESGKQAAQAEQAKKRVI